MQEPLWQFSEPLWMHSIWLIVILGMLLWKQIKMGYQQSTQWMVDELRPNLMIQASLNWRFRQLLLALIALIFGTVSLMRPIRIGTQQVEVQSQKADVMIALDLSKSMWAEDSPPSRLERAKYEIMEMVDAMPGYRFGLVGFAGNATVLCPLTSDLSFFQLTLQQASPYSISKGGTQIGDGLRKAMQAFAGGQAPKLIVLITDGEDHDSRPMEVVEQIKELGIPIVSLGFGSESGSPITITDSQTGAKSTLKDLDGQEVLSRLDGELLRDIALQSSGAFIPAGVASLDLEGIVSEHITPIVLSNHQENQVQITEQYSFFVFIAIFSMLLMVVMDWRRQ